MIFEPSPYKTTADPQQKQIFDRPLKKYQYIFLVSPPKKFVKSPLKKNMKKIMVSMLLSALVKRFSVSRMQNLFCVSRMNEFEKKTLLFSVLFAF